MAKKNPLNEKLVIIFGQNVRKYRIEKRLTQNQLADICDVEFGTISTVERGKVNCTISTALAISKALDVSIDTLFQDLNNG